MGGFEAGFFNNVVTVAVVLLFTKLVTHRSGNRRAKRGGPWLWWALHAVCTVCAVSAVLVSLAAVHYQEDSNGYRSAVWILLGAALLIQAGDVFGEDMPPWQRRDQAGGGRDA